MRHGLSTQPISGEEEQSPMLRHGESRAEKTLPSPWGRLPEISLASAAGLLVMAFADNAGRAALPWADVLFWLSLLIIFTPTAARLMFASAQRRERIGLLVVLGLALYLVKILAYPDAFAFIDEYLHWRTAQDIALTGHLFQPNPLLPVSPYFSGLEIVTNALSTLSGLSIFTSGVIVVGVARLVAVLAVYLFFEQIGRSGRVAGIATLVFLANPLTLFFDAQFAYESLGLAFAALILYALSLRTENPTRYGWEPVAVAGVALGALMLTHHLTSYLLVAFLVFWALISLAAHRREGSWKSIGVVALLGLALMLVEVLLSGNRVAAYLVPRVANDVGALIQIATGGETGRQLFRDNTGAVAAGWERAASLIAAGIIQILLLVGLVRIWRHHRASAAALACGIAAVVYPFTQVIRLTPDGAETSARVTDFLFVLIGLVVAIGLLQPWRSGTSGRTYRLIATGVLVLMLIGGVIGAGPSWFRLPGPYLVAAGPRSLNTEGVAAAEWAQSYLGPGRRVATDFTDQLLMGTYGHERVITGLNDLINLGPVFFAPRIGSDEMALLTRARVQYIVVDRRLSTGLPKTGFYFERLEPGALQHTAPIAPALLAKFDQVTGINRVFDSGNLVIYDMRGFLHEP